MIMPYECSSGDGQPVVVHLQQLEDPYDVVDFCQTCWVTFIVASAESLGMTRPTASGIPDDPAPGDLGPAAEPPQEAQEATGEAARVVVPVGAATTDQRPDADDPAPY